MFRLLAATLPVMLAASAAWAQTYDHPHMWGYGWGMMIFGPVMMIGVIVAIIVVAVLVMRWLGGVGPHGHVTGPAQRTPLDVLKERFARGEIDKQEFEERKKLLSD